MRPFSKTLYFTAVFSNTHTHRIWDFPLIPKSLLCHMAEIICVLSQAAVVATATCSSARRQTLWERGLSLSLSACVWEPTFGGKKGNVENRLGWKKVQTGCSALVANEVTLLFWWMWELVQELVNIMYSSVNSLRLFVYPYEAISWVALVEREWAYLNATQHTRYVSVYVCACVCVTLALR